MTFDLFQDQRGFFTRLFCKQEFSHYFPSFEVVQMNQSFNHHKGTVRGLHFQRPPHAEAKWIRVLKGKIFDVILDLRKSSSTFLKVFTTELNEDDGKMLFIPQGCAHGFQTMTDQSELLYLHTDYFAPHAEEGIRYNDPFFKIDWPLSVTNISERDQTFPLFTPNAFQGLEI